MRVLRGTLTFILGMIIGIILFVIAIGGAVYLVGTSVTVGELQQKFTDQEIISSESELYDKSVWDTLVKVAGDMKNFNNLTLQSLYESYGIKLLNGIGDVDFTSKEFYSMPLGDLFKDMSVVIDSFTLGDVSSLAKFELPDLPIFTDNTGVGVKTALSNIMGSINGDLSIRDVKNNFGIDMGVDKNKVLAAMQDAKLSSFGDMLNVLRLNSFIDVDSDSFVKSGRNDVYVKLGDEGVYEEVSKDDLALKKSHVAKTGVETFYSAALDTDNDGKANTMSENEIRYVLKTKTDAETGESTSSYVVDNSCYDNDFDAENNEKTFYRHVEYAINDGTYTAGNPSYFVLSYANKIDIYTDETYTLVQKDFFPLNDIKVLYDGNFVMASTIAATSATIDIQDVVYSAEEKLAERFYVSDRPITKDSRLTKRETPQVGDYIIVHDGTSSSVMQLVAFMTVSELQNSDDLLDSLTIGDVVDTEVADTAKILKALSDCKLSEVGSKIDTLPLAEMIDINFDAYTAATSEKGSYVLVEEKDSNGNFVYVKFDDGNPNSDLFARYSYDGENYVASPTGKYMRSCYFTLYNPAVHDVGHVAPTTYSKTAQPGASSKALQRLAYSSLDGFSDSFGKLTLGEVMDIDADTYEYDESNTHGSTFYYDALSSLYMRVTEANKDEHLSDDKFFVAKEGSSTSVLKRLAFVKVDGLSDAMEKVMKDIMLSELVDVYNEYAVEEKASFDISHYNKETDRFFLEDTDGDGFVFAYDDHGKYVHSQWVMVEYTADELASIANSTAAYSYKEVTSQAEGSAAVLENNVFYRYEKDGVVYYENNVPLCTYLIKKTPMPTGKIYTRISGTSGENPQTNAPVYGASGNVYVLLNGTYVKYDSSKLAHLDQTRYYKQVAGDCYARQSQAGILNGTGVTFGQDSTYKLTKHVAEDVYFKTTNETNAYVYIGKQYVPYDKNVHGESVELFQKKRGYVASLVEVYIFSDVKNLVVIESTKLDYTPVTVIREKSQAVLRMLASKGTTVDNINDAVETATLKDIMDVDEDSLFYRFKDANVNKLSTEVESSLKEMSVGELLDYINITTVNPVVKAALKDVTMTNFFNSLSYDVTTGMIYVDMEKACGY